MYSPIGGRNIPPVKQAGKDSQAISRSQEEVKEWSKAGIAGARPLPMNQQEKLERYRELTYSFNTCISEIRSHEQHIKELLDSYGEKITEVYEYVDSIVTFSIFGPNGTGAPNKYPKAIRNSDLALIKIRDIAVDAQKRVEYVTTAITMITMLEQFADEMLKRAANIEANEPPTQPTAVPSARGRSINRRCQYCDSEVASTKCAGCRTVSWPYVLTTVRSKSPLARQARCTACSLSPSLCTCRTTSPQQKTCKNCKRQVNSNMTYCPHCNKGAVKMCTNCQWESASGPSGLCGKCARSLTPTPRSTRISQTGSYAFQNSTFRISKKS